jgi:hypothetical protein
MDTATRDEIIEVIEAAFERSADKLMARLEARYGLDSDCATTTETEAQARELLGGNR